MQNNYTKYGEGGIIMAEQVLIQFRADKALKQEVAEIYETLGMDLPTAFRMFMTRSKMVKGLPFEATLPETTITRAEAKNCLLYTSPSPRDLGGSRMPSSA